MKRGCIVINLLNTVYGFCFFQGMEGGSESTKSSRFFDLLQLENHLRFI